MEIASQGEYLERLEGGDVYARFLLRYYEVHNSLRLIKSVFERWSEEPTYGDRLIETVRFDPRRNYAFGLGYAEGCRGDVIYWVMQDKQNRIFRCKVRDPSMLNWPALRQSILPKKEEPSDERKGKRTLLSDFPLINKSFDLSYSGNDL